MTTFFQDASKAWGGRFRNGPLMEHVGGKTKKNVIFFPTKDEYQQSAHPRREKVTPILAVWGLKSQKMIENVFWNVLKSGANTKNTPPPKNTPPSKRTFFRIPLCLVTGITRPQNTPPLLNDPNLFEGGGILSETQWFGKK